MKKIYSIFMMLFITAMIGAQGTETFEAQTVLTSGYADGTFSGETTGVIVNYTHSRNEGLTTADDYSITGKGLMLRRASDSYVEFVIPNGVGTFTFQYRKAFTGAAPRQLEVLVNNVVAATTAEFGGVSGADATVYTQNVTVNQSGSTTIKIKNVGTTTTNRQTTIDNVSWTAGSTQPSILVSPAFINFGNISSGATSGVETVNVSGSNLTAAPTYSITGPAASMYNVTGTLTTAGGTLDVYFAPTSGGFKEATLTITSGSISSVVHLEGTGTTAGNPYGLDDSAPLSSLVEDFETGAINSSVMPNDWSNIAVQGNDRLWEIKSFNNNKYAQMTSHNGTGAYQTMLISPAVDLNEIQKNNVTFQWNSGYTNGAELKVYLIQLVGGTMQTTLLQTINDNSNPTGYGAAFNTVNLDLTPYTGIAFLAFEYNGVGGTTTTTYQIDNVNMPAASLAVNDVTQLKNNFVKNTLVTENIYFGSEADVKIYNMNGQVVRTAKVSENNNMNVSDLQPGAYIVTGIVNGQPVSQKILKK